MTLGLGLQSAKWRGERPVVQLRLLGSSAVQTACSLASTVEGLKWFLGVFGSSAVSSGPKTRQVVMAKAGGLHIHSCGVQLQVSM